VWLLTHSEAAQFLALLAVFYLPGILAQRRFGTTEREYQAPFDKSPPWRIVALSVVLILPAGTAIYFLSGAIDLGLFWLFALLWPWIEIYEALSKRDIRLHGTSDWKPERPFRDAAVAIPVMTLAIAALAVLDGASLPEAVLTGGACGLIVFGLAVFFRWLDSRLSASG
jgi:hypothetical protein